MMIRMLSDGYRWYGRDSFHEVILKVEDTTRQRIYYLVAIPEYEGDPFFQEFDPNDTVLYRQEGSPYLKGNRYHGYWIQDSECEELIESNKAAKSLLKK